MTPDECASIRSIARWVLPVLVGPSTAVTPEPGARSWPNEEEKVIIYRCFFLLLAPFVIASAAKQSMGNGGRMDCFVAALLAMTRKLSTHLSFGTTCADYVSQCDALTVAASALERLRNEWRPNR